MSIIYKNYIILNIEKSRDRNHRYDCILYNHSLKNTIRLHVANKSIFIYKDNTKIKFYANSKYYKVSNNIKDKENYIRRNRKNILSGLTKEYIEYKYFFK